MGHLSPFVMLGLMNGNRKFWPPLAVGGSALLVGAFLSVLFEEKLGLWDSLKENRKDTPHIAMVCLKQKHGTTHFWGSLRWTGRGGVCRGSEGWDVPVFDQRLVPNRFLALGNFGYSGILADVWGILHSPRALFAELNHWGDSLPEGRMMAACAWAASGNQGIKTNAGPSCTPPF